MHLLIFYTERGKKEERKEGREKGRENIVFFKNQEFCSNFQSKGYYFFEVQLTSNEMGKLK